MDGIAYKWQARRKKSAWLKGFSTPFFVSYKAPVVN
jgi:hypothetical protein